MALTLVKETGAGLANANSYANAADGDAYHDGHLYATAWTAASAGQKDAALVMATRLIDAYMDFGGKKASGVQALQWPRSGCVNPDEPRGPLGLAGWGGSGTFDSNAVPAVVVAATCEMARELIIADRTTAPLGEGLKSSQVADSIMVFDRPGRAPVISRVALALLTKVGAYRGEGDGMVALQRA